jgi:O-antigen/teichoic acid export membrane protein
LSHDALLDEQSPVVPSTVSHWSGRLAPALRGSVSLAAGSAASFFVGLALVPLTIGYLGSARFGAWMTIAAVAALMEPLDLGLGSALVTLLAKASGRGDRVRGAQFFRAALTWSSMMGLAVFAVVIVGAPHVHWAALFHIDGAVAGDAQPLVLVFGCAFAIGLPLTVIDRALIGLRRTGWLGIRMLVGHSLSLVMVSLGAALHSSVVVLAALALSGPLLAQAVSAMVLVRRTPWLVARGPRDDAALPTLIRSGGLFFTLQLASAVAFTSDQVVIARVLDAESVRVSRRLRSYRQPSRSPRCCAAARSCAR